METVIMENLVSVAGTLLITLIGVGGAWLTAQISKHQQLKNINAAQQEVTKAAQTTVLELQQTTVEGWKKAHEDGKLTNEEVAKLGRLLLKETMKKLSMPTIKLLNAASVDINAIITGAGEALIAKMKQCW